MPLPKLKVEKQLTPDQAGRAEPPSLGTLVLKVVLSLPFFLGAALFVVKMNVSHISLVLTEIALICAGTTIVLTKSFVVGAIAFILGSVPLISWLYSAMVMGVFGGHQ